MKILTLFISFSIVLSFVHDACAKGEKVEKTELFGHQLVSHPRLLFTLEREENVKSLLKDGDPTLQKLYALNMEVADELLTQAVQTYQLSSRKNLLGIARETLKRVTVLGTAYRLSGEEKYANKLVDNILGVCAYKD